MHSGNHVDMRVLRTRRNDHLYIDAYCAWVVTKAFLVRSVSSISAMNVVYAEYEKSLFAGLSNVLDGLIPVVDLQKLICAYAKKDIVDVTIAVISDLRAVRFDVAHLKFKVRVSCESYKTFAPPYKDEVRIVFTAKETELLDNKKLLVGYSTLAWTIDYARHHFYAKCIAQDIELLTRFDVRMLVTNVHEIEKIMLAKMLAAANEIVMMSIAAAKKLGSAELLGSVEDMH